MLLLVPVNCHANRHKQRESSAILYYQLFLIFWSLVQTWSRIMNICRVKDFNSSILENYQSSKMLTFSLTPYLRGGNLCTISITYFNKYSDAVHPRFEYDSCAKKGLVLSEEDELDNSYNTDNLNYDAIVDKDEIQIIRYLLVNITRNKNWECLQQKCSTVTLAPYLPSPVARVSKQGATRN